MGKSSKYTHYIQRVDVTTDQLHDLEDFFPGLLYEKLEGLFNVGKSKNIYIEEYADSDRKRVYLPEEDNYTNEGTTMKLTVLIVGDVQTRLSTLNEFTEYIRKGVHRYWDTARYREFHFVVTDEIKVSEERWHGSTPYIEVEVPMQNIYGNTNTALRLSNYATAKTARDAAASVDQKVIEGYTLPEFSIDEETMELQADVVPITDQFSLENGNLTVEADVVPITDKFSLENGNLTVEF